MHMPFSPQSLLPAELIRQLRDAAADAEAAGRLTEDQLAIIFRQGWFRMFLPRTMGGLDLSLPEGLRVEEGLAWIDGSLGWTVTLCSGATLFAGFMEPGVAAQLLADPPACFGGSGAPTGTAERNAGGYRVSGHWRYATGAPHLSVFTANCRIIEGGTQVLNEEGQDLIQSFFFMKDEVELREDWFTIGLKATAGHAFSVSGLQLPESRTFRIAPEAAQYASPILQYPFLSFAEATLAVNTSGMTLHFLDICEQLFAQRGSDRRYDEASIALMNAALIRAKGEIAQLRDHFYHAADRSWESLTEQGAARPDSLAAVGVSSRSLVKACRQIVHDLYPYCGMQAADPRTEINRVWRDIFTASQHTLLTYPV